MTKKTDYIAWGLDEADPANIDDSMAKREEIFNRVLKRLDRITLLVLVSTVAQLALIYQIYTQL